MSEKNSQQLGPHDPPRDNLKEADLAKRESSRQPHPIGDYVGHFDRFAKPNVVPAPQHCHKGCHKNNNPDSKLRRLYTGFRNVSEIVYFWASAAVLCFLAWQIREMRLQRILDERAWITRTKIELSKPNGEPVVTISLKNTGRTPALNIQTEIGVATSLDAIPKFQNSPKEQERISYMLGPGEELPMPGNLKSSVGIEFWFFGVVWYDDIFGQHHWTRATLHFDTNMAIGIPKQGNDCDTVGTQ